MQQEPTTHSVLYLFLADDEGLGTVYPLLLDMLRNRPGAHISLVYYSFTGRYVFGKELDTLMKHFPSVLLVYYEQCDSADAQTNQETIEVILNTNTKDVLQCLVALPPALQYPVVNQLAFIGVTTPVLVTSHNIQDYYSK